jgi:hypothetical protein
VRATSLPPPEKVIHTRGQIFLFVRKSPNGLTRRAFSQYSAPLFTSFGVHLVAEKTKQKQNGQYNEKNISTQQSPP